MTKVIKITFDDSDIQTDNGDVFYHCNLSLYLCNLS